MGGKTEDELRKCGPLGAIFGDSVPQLLFSQGRRSPEVSGPGGAAAYHLSSAPGSSLSALLP